MGKLIWTSAKLFIVIDIMATDVLKVRLTGLTTFQDLLSAFVSFLDVYHQFGRCDYLFDMYSDDPSVKDSERMRRADTVPIEHSSIVRSYTLT